MLVTVLQDFPLQQWASKEKVILVCAMLSCIISPVQCSLQENDDSNVLQMEMADNPTELNFNERHKTESELPLMSSQNHFNKDQVYGDVMEGINGTLFSDNSSSKTLTLFYAFISATLVGLSGVIPLMFLNTAPRHSKALDRLLSFAVGSMLGDVFLHLLPESWEQINYSHHDDTIHHSHQDGVTNGVWIMLGLLGFCVLEKCFPDDADESINNNRSIKASGYLNLLANCIDNLAHGLAVGGAYLVCQRVGILTTLAILLHEIPHEVGDFAILLRAGFDKWHAAKMQIMTASGSVIGAVAAFACAEFAGKQVTWILPFTSGGFIYIALCQVVPDILNKDTSPKESLLQMVLILTAVFIMHFVTYLE